MNRFTDAVYDDMIKYDNYDEFVATMEKNVTPGLLTSDLYKALNTIDLLEKKLEKAEQRIKSLGDNPDAKKVEVDAERLQELEKCEGDLIEAEKRLRTFEGKGKRIVQINRKRFDELERAEALLKERTAFDNPDSDFGNLIERVDKRKIDNKLSNQLDAAKVRIINLEKELNRSKSISDKTTEIKMKYDFEVKKNANIERELKRLKKLRETYNNSSKKIMQLELDNKELNEKLNKYDALSSDKLDKTKAFDFIKTELDRLQTTVKLCDPQSNIPKRVESLKAIEDYIIDEIIYTWDETSNDPYYAIKWYAEHSERINEMFGMVKKSKKLPDSATKSE